MHNTVGEAQFSTLFDDFARELLQYRPSVVVVGGLRMILSADDNQQGFNILCLVPFTVCYLGLHYEFNSMTCMPDHSRFEGNRYYIWYNSRLY